MEYYNQMSFSDDFQFLISLMEKYNLSAHNIIYQEKVPEEVSVLFSKIVEENSLDVIALFKEIEKIHKPDPNRITTRRYFDIDVKIKNNLVSEHYSKLEYTKDGLVSVPNNSTIIKDGFEYKNSYFIFPKTIRENYNLTSWFIDNWNGQFDLAFYISNKHLGIKETKRPCFLKAHWWGPKTLEHIKQQLKTNLMLVKGNNNSMSKNIPDKVDFFFTRDKEDNFRFEIEETIPYNYSLPHNPHINLNNNDFLYFTRYVHGITDKNMERCFHLDLSVKGYETFVEYQKRARTTIKLATKSKKYQKLIRLDSKGGIESFGELIGLYFLFNPFILELFEGESSMTEEIEEQREKILFYSLKKAGIYD